jgi:hypothetical protein
LKHAEELLVGGLEDRTKWALVEWNIVFSPKLIRGISIRDPKISNEVMEEIIWWEWETYTNEAWAQLWNCKSSHGWDKQNLIRFAEELLRSYIWKSSQKNHFLVQQHYFWEI